MKNLMYLFLLCCLSTFGQNVGIGLDGSPTEKLEVKGIIFSRQGGIKFPDGTIQTTAYIPDSSAMMQTGLSALVIEFSQDTPIDIIGPATDTGISNAINVSSAQEGMAIGVALQSGTFTFTNPNLSEFTFTRTADLNSSKFRGLLLTKQIIPYIEVFYLKLLANNTTYVSNHIIRFENCAITQFSSSSGGEIPSEAISFSYEKSCYRSYKRNTAGAEIEQSNACYNQSTLSSNCSCSF